MDRSRATELLQFLRNQHAYFLKLKSAPSVSKFSNMPGTIAYDYCPGKVTLSDLFDISEDVLMGRETDEDKAAAVKRLKTALSDKSGAEALVTTLYEKLYERDQFLHIVYSLLTLLTPTVAVNAMTYSAKMLSDNDMQELIREYMGVGDHMTWHGSPDGRADWVPLQSLQRIDSSGSGSESDESARGKTSYEAKKSFSGENTDQLVGHSVVCSFTHCNKHPAQNGLVPAVGISGEGGEMMAILYDCHVDVMLKIFPLPWMNFGEKCYDMYGIFVLWLLLHHRLFLKNLADYARLPKAQVLEIFRQSGSLSLYQSLTSNKRTWWPKVDLLKPPNIVDLISLHDVPPLKKQRIG